MGSLSTHRPSAGRGRGPWEPRGAHMRSPVDHGRPRDLRTLTPSPGRGAKITTPFAPRGGASQPAPRPGLDRAVRASCYTLEPPLRGWGHPSARCSAQRAAGARGLWSDRAARPPGVPDRTGLLPVPIRRRARRCGGGETYAIAARKPTSAEPLSAGPLRDEQLPGVRQPAEHGPAEHRPPESQAWMRSQLR